MQLQIQTIFASFILILLIFLINRKEKLPHNNVFTLFIGALFCSSVFEILMLSDILTDRTNFSQFISYLYGPLLFWYVQVICGRIDGKTRLAPFHFLPAVLVLSIELVNSATPIFANIPLWKFLAILVVAHNMFYLALSIKTIQDARSKNYMRELKSWMRFLSWGYALLLATFAMELVCALLNQFELMFTIRYAGLLLQLIYVSGMVYFGLSKPLIFNSKTKYAYSTLDYRRKTQLIQKLQNLMIDEQPYLSPNLTLNETAAKLDADPLHLSQAINEHYNKNFKDYLNTYRIQKAKELLINEPSLIIKEIMYSSGFQAKSTFNLVFTKSIGVSPSRFRRNHTIK
ncbi:helix-turn-helix domain-containing protein [Muricauda sp. 2012CJ35-5]|uniref:Helix-turn-helix domain-containing protein n=1 Tax=Flagellimonas spongiicola TaxID=2942208 RepID=A0ABT0PYA5_9FLAO|nr:helix-turn-helix domain-containing protein [Allomuricauda spongiicola]MCL6275458.1 helix-turn-helix domain-containing protein [Allomuricauda spongiicola]